MGLLKYGDTALYNGTSGIKYVSALFMLCVMIAVGLCKTFRRQQWKYKKGGFGLFLVDVFLSIPKIMHLCLGKCYNSCPIAAVWRYVANGVGGFLRQHDVVFKTTVKCATAAACHVLVSVVAGDPHTM